MEKDVLLLLQGLQDEVRCESRPIRQVASALGDVYASAPENVAQGAALKHWRPKR